MHSRSTTCARRPAPPSTLPDDVAPRAFLLALGVGLDDSQSLATIPEAAEVGRGFEAASERAIRLALLGEPTMRERRDLAQHFFVSAYLDGGAWGGSGPRGRPGQGTGRCAGRSGFSFADIAADRAGVRFASGVLNKQIPLAIAG